MIYSAIIGLNYLFNQHEYLSFGDLTEQYTISMPRAIGYYYHVSWVDYGHLSESNRYYSGCVVQTKFVTVNKATSIVTFISDILFSIVLSGSLVAVYRILFLSSLVPIFCSKLFVTLVVVIGLLFYICSEMFVFYIVVRCLLFYIVARCLLFYIVVRCFLCYICSEILIFYVSF